MLTVSSCSKRIKHVVMNTLAAEMIALVNTATVYFWLQSVANDILGTSNYFIDYLLTANHCSMQSIQ